MARMMRWKLCLMISSLSFIIYVRLTDNTQTSIISKTGDSARRPLLHRAKKHGGVLGVKHPGTQESIFLPTGHRTTFDHWEPERHPNLSRACPFPAPSTLHPIKVNVTEIDVAEVTRQLPFVSPGGAHRPTQCQSRSRVAIVVAFRDRGQHLGIFLRHLHPFLRRQLLDYRIFIIHMSPGGPFNKGSLFNAGYFEIQQRFPDHFDCMVLQDVDVLPETDRISYACKETAWHLASYVDKFGYKLLYDAQIGGSFQISFDDFKRANGFSNQFRGWGGEDDDFERRLGAHHISYGRLPEWSRWTTLKHKPSPHFSRRGKALARVWKLRLRSDGLRNLKYEVLNYMETRLYTNISVVIKNRSSVRGLYADVNQGNRMHF